MTPTEFTAWAALLNGATYVRAPADRSVVFLWFGPTSARVYAYDRHLRQVAQLEAPTRNVRDVEDYIDGLVAAAARAPEELPHE